MEESPVPPTTSTPEVPPVPEYPSDVIDFFEHWKITMGDGSNVDDLVGYAHKDFFFTANDGIDWVVYKTPNAGGTTPNSSNTRSELKQLSEWVPETAGRLTATLKVMHVSTTGDRTVPASFSVIVGQIHSGEGHENEPLKIFYKKYPGHERGSLFWNYEINTEGPNGQRWDVAFPVWGDDWSVLGPDANTDPPEPADGVRLGEEFSYEVVLQDGVMYLTFLAVGRPAVTFEKSLIASEYTEATDLPDQVRDLFGPAGQGGTERPSAYAGELQYFKQGAYNQSNGKDPATHPVWSTGSETYGGDLEAQYANGSYAEVWFRSAAVSEG